MLINKNLVFSIWHNLYNEQFSFFQQEQQRQQMKFTPGLLSTMEHRLRFKLLTGASLKASQQKNYSDLGLCIESGKYEVK